MEKFLPIGSIVILNGAEKRLMITGYLVKESENNQEFDYSGCIYPYGIMDAEKTLLFNHEQINYIYNYGICDEECKEYLNYLKKASEELKNVEIPTLVSENN